MMTQGVDRSRQRAFGISLMSADATSSRRVPVWRLRLADLRGRGIYAGVPDEHRCIFVHIPKTAGSSISEGLFGIPSRHVTYEEYLRANPRKFRSYFKFAFVRNPWDRLVSTYFFLKKDGMNELDRAWAREYLSPYGDFDDFVKRGLRRIEIQSWVHFRPQCEFIAAQDGTLMVDFVGRFERLHEDFAVVSNKLGLPVNLRHTNSGEHGRFESLYSAATAEIVGDVYARDIETFGYREPA
jgi:hypothetical protein